MLLLFDKSKQRYLNMKLFSAHFEYGSEAKEVGVPIDDEGEHDQQAIEDFQSGT